MYPASTRPPAYKPIKVPSQSTRKGPSLDVKQIASRTRRYEVKPVDLKEVKMLPNKLRVHPAGKQEDDREQERVARVNATPLALGFLGIYCRASLGRLQCDDW